MQGWSGIEFLAWSAVVAVALPVIAFLSGVVSGFIESEFRD